MLSLGYEIKTSHGHYIDNLFLDGHGTLVVAELKRGKTTREVTAQVLDYAAYVSGLTWPGVTALCEKRHGCDLRHAIKLCFGVDLILLEKPEHRLLIVAEKFEPSIEDAVAYLINTGINICLLEYRFFDLGGMELVDTRVILGELPKFEPSPTAVKANRLEEADGYINWLGRTIRDELRGGAMENGIELGTGDRYINFIPAPWPYPLGECRFTVGINSKDIGLYFAFLNERIPREVGGHLRQLVSDHSSPYEPNRLTVAHQWTTLTHSVPRPAFRNVEQVKEVVAQALAMMKLIAPLIREPERREHEMDP